MAGLGVFRDDFYNAMCVMAAAVSTARTDATGVTLPAAAIVGGDDVYVLESGQTTAVTLNFDSAVNIIAALNNAVAVAVKASQAAGGGLATGLGTPQSMPNLFNCSWILTIVNNNTVSGAITLSAASSPGVTLVAGAAIAIATSVEYLVQVTSPTTVSITRVASKTA